MKHLFIVNPTAGGQDKTAAITAEVERVFAGRSEDFEVYTTKVPLDACKKIEYEAEMYEDLRVYACGGDGTLNECVSASVGRKNVSVTCYPTGTGNDFIKTFGEEKKLFHDLDALVNGEVHQIDVIECNDRYSINICSVGIDARIGTPSSAEPPDTSLPPSSISSRASVMTCASFVTASSTMAI